MTDTTPLQLDKIAAALIEFNAKIGKIKKDTKNPFFKSTYASLSTILEAIGEPLRETGLSFVQFPSGQYGLRTILMHVSGQYIEDSYDMKPIKDDPQGRGSCITYQRRYALASILGLNIDSDDDGNAASGKITDTELPWLNEGSLQFKAVKKRLLDKTTTLEEVQSHYRLSKETKELLLA